MLTALTLLALAAALPQDTVLDVPVFEDATFGVSLPRPFEDWVFVPATSRGTTTVIFHPRDASLRDQFWGALVLTTFDTDVPLGRVADQRVAGSWRGLLGPSFTLLTRDSITVCGLPAIHVVMGGAIEHAVLDVEEYLIARGGDLILLQFRYPRGLARDSMAAGYQHSLDGLRIVGGGAPRVTERPVPAPPATLLRALALSPWQATGYDVLVRYDAPRGRLEVAARLEVRNDGAVSQRDVPLAVPLPAGLDSVAAGAMSAVPSRGALARLLLAAPSAPQDEASVVAFYHVDEPRPVAGGVGVLMDQPWLPLVEAPSDTLGRPRRLGHPRLVLRFDLPDTLRAVAAGRLTSEAVAAGRRRMTWLIEAGSALGAEFAVGPYRSESLRAGPTELRLWRLAAPDTALPDRAVTLAALVDRATTVFTRMFGQPAGRGIAVAESDAPRAGASPGLVFVAPGLVVDSAVLLRDVARLWWGGAIHADGEGAGFLLEGFPAWAGVAARGVLEGDSVRHRLVREAEAVWRSAEQTGRDRPLVALDPYQVGDRELLRAKSIAALEAVRRAIGEARFREAMKTFALENREGAATVSSFLLCLGEAGSGTLRSYLFGR